MIKINKLKFSKNPLVALSISDQEAYADIKRSGADLLEIRLDCFRRLTSNYITNRIKKLKRLGLPMILTIRSKQEGGRLGISDKERLSLFSSLIGLVGGIDIELSSSILPDIVRLAKRNRRVIIVSNHNLKATPSFKELEEIFKKALGSGADIVKIAARANCPQDVLRLLEFTLCHRGRGIITMSLGKLGSLSRIISPFCGSLLSYAYLKKPFALGQLSCREFLRQLRFYYPEK